MLTGLDTQDDRRLHRTPSAPSVACKLPETLPVQPKGGSAANMHTSLLGHTVFCSVQTLMENSLPKETSSANCSMTYVTSRTESQVSADSVLLAERPGSARKTGLLFRSQRLLRHSPAGPPVDLRMCFAEIFLPIKPPPQQGIQSAGSAGLCFITTLLFRLMRTP